MTRKPFEWKLRDRTLVLGERTLIMGVLNVTPDSFSDGGLFLDPEHALAIEAALDRLGDFLDQPGENEAAALERRRALARVAQRARAQSDSAVDGAGFAQYPSLS